MSVGSARSAPLIVCLAAFTVAAGTAAAANAAGTTVAAAGQQHAFPAVNGRQLRFPIPTKPEHVEFVVQTNKKGQVVKVRSGKECDDTHFNAFTYGNALQAFIRKADGNAVAGLYELTYDYNPRTLAVRRGVRLLQSGGKDIDPNAQGAVDQMADVNKRRADRESLAKAHATPLPDFRDITGHK